MGHDWHDFIWYIARRTPVNYDLLTSSLRRMGPWNELALTVDRSWCAAHMGAKVQVTNWRQARGDVRGIFRRA